MIVFLVRHAYAADEAPGLPDHARSLTTQGRRAARGLGERLRWYDCDPTHVWTSPATRAVQTAELLIGGLGWDGPVDAVAELAPGGPIETVAERLRALSSASAVILVGHAP